MQEDGRVVPIYSDKYFAYDWADAKAMYDRVRQMNIPFLCGSTVPLTWRRPPLEVLARRASRSADDQLQRSRRACLSRDRAAAGHGRAAGGRRDRSGARPLCEGEEVWRWPSGEWSQDLLDAALARGSTRAAAGAGSEVEAFLVRYPRRAHARVDSLNAMARDYLFAARMEGRSDPVSSCFYIQLYLHNHWSFMVRNFEDLVLTRRKPNPIERTLVANGIMLAGSESRRKGGQWVDTPELDICVLMALWWPRYGRRIHHGRRSERACHGDPAAAVVKVSVPARSARLLRRADRRRGNGRRRGVAGSGRSWP